MGTQLPLSGAVWRYASGGGSPKTAPVWRIAMDDVCQEQATARDGTAAQGVTDDIGKWPRVQSPHGTGVPTGFPHRVADH